MPAQPMQTQSMPTPLHLRTDNIPCANSGWHATTSPPSTTPVPMIAKKEASPVMHPERRDSLGSTETDSTCDDHSPRSTHFSLSAFRLAKPVTPTLSLETPCPVYTCTDRPFASYGQDHGLLFSPLPKQMHSSPVSMPTAPPPSLFSSVNEVRLPPLRHILNNQEKPVEHDAAAAMIQLAKPTHAPFAEDMFHQRKLVPFSQLSCSSKPSSPGVMVFH
ncbi:uncharacterized protein BYT42DRAFT_329195 [Radiomyces spectabilis]|uniref:uncharacterized protein n=1 Tax=Radiomyces spectabilis TaxID=64574 RepID=UPI00221EA18B|nr:uncharacterized protein BYT42DRAFT_329195 [Radiomyces spectabilis]KAI8379496.1 hypothetical protein BYT42DRAFT_329195 [Radiomyces spectabilis]